MPDWEAKLGNHTGDQSREAMLVSLQAAGSNQKRQA